MLGTGIRSSWEELIPPQRNAKFQQENYHSFLDENSHVNAGPKNCGKGARLDFTNAEVYTCIYLFYLFIYILVLTESPVQYCWFKLSFAYDKKNKLINCQM